MESGKGACGRVRVCVREREMCARTRRQAGRQAGEVLGVGSGVATGQQRAARETAAVVLV